MGEIPGMCHPRGGFAMSMATDKGSTDARLEKGCPRRHDLFISC